MKKFKPEDFPWTDAGTTANWENLQERSPMLKHIDKMQAELSKYQQTVRFPTNTAYVGVDFAKLEDFTKYLEPPQPILNAFERVAKQLAEKSAQVDAERILRLIMEPWLPIYTKQVMLLTQDNQKAQDFFERYIQPEIKSSPMTEAIQNHLTNKEKDHD